MGRKRFFLNILLVFVSIFLAYEVYEVLRAPAAFRDPPPEAQVRDNKPKETLAILPVPPPKIEYNAIGQKNLFRPQRSEWTAPKPEAKGEAAKLAQEAQAKPGETALDKIRLYGTAIYGNGKKIAILGLPPGQAPSTPGVIPSQKDLQGGIRNMHPGDVVAGYRIAEILYDRIVLEKNGEASELLVRDPKKPKARPQPLPLQDQAKSAEAAKTLQNLLKSTPEKTEQKAPEPQKPLEPGKQVIDTPFGPKVVEEQKTQ